MANGVTNLGGFEDFIDEQTENIQKEGMDYVVKIGLDLMTLIIWRNPVDTGRSRAGWNMAWGGPATGGVGNQVEESESDWSKSQARSQVPFENIAGQAERIGKILGMTLHITNNVNYIKYLENGHPGPGSEQAPSGMVQVSIEQLQGKYS